MNYKAMLDKIQELEARIDALERGQSKQTTFPSAPQFTYPPHVEINPPWQITCQNNTGTLQ